MIDCKFRENFLIFELDNSKQLQYAKKTSYRTGGAVLCGNNTAACGHRPSMVGMDGQATIPAILPGTQFHCHRSHSAADHPLRTHLLLSDMPYGCIPGHHHSGAFNFTKSVYNEDDYEAYMPLMAEKYQNDKELAKDYFKTTTGHARCQITFLSGLNLK